ncbi:OsmC family protein [Crenobacter cavernae]|uniref:OsmC family peroxiredoxin n=1 Tax=Crenobacter cavernae TaxID=2290923 RepID=A0A345Y8A9_9NEIS|nr:OsmC family protein [Crenobacter cavernae]AXK40161.1 OsmC family peroxiredoxin [Crenobacter cavernae]
MRLIASASVTSTPFNYTHRVETAGFELLSDEPPSSGGQNAGPAPYDYLLASLGACTAITLRMYAEKKGWHIGELQISLTLSKDQEGRAWIERSISTDALLDDTQWARLLEIADKSPVTRTLLKGANISTSRAAPENV